MDRLSDILISVERRHVQNMLLGHKTVELRRRPIRVEAGCRIWIYSKLPHGQVDAFAIVADVIGQAPRQLWYSYGNVSCITKKEFDDYFAGRSVGYAIILDRIVPITSGVTLDEIRRTSARFHPPQFFKRLYPNCPELSLFEAAVAA